MANSVKQAIAQEFGAGKMKLHEGSEYWKNLINDHKERCRENGQQFCELNAKTHESFKRRIDQVLGLKDKQPAQFVEQSHKLIRGIEKHDFWPEAKVSDFQMNLKVCDEYLER